jgi:GNAT superfamily N-acetyltransferase
MDIKVGIESDIPAIVDLLKKSLGEDLLPKSEHYWRWKHLENPFGASPVLVCWEESKIIGVRAFMRWEWISQGQLYRAVRAVDTATHPNYQGKGIFKKLTLSAIDFCKQEGVHFAFNTPNKQSKPGYLKMGWQEAGTLPVVVGIQKPLSLIGTLLVKSIPKQNSIDNNPIAYFLNHPGLKPLLEKNRPSSKIITNVSVDYLRWRYLRVPVARYVAVGEEQRDELKGLIIGRIKETRLGRELRITDFFCHEKHIEKKLNELLKENKKSWGIDYTTMSGTMQSSRSIVGKFRWACPIGPVVTIRHIDLLNLSILQQFRHWSPSFGDLELF